MLLIKDLQCVKIPYKFTAIYCFTEVSRLKKRYNYFDDDYEYIQTPFDKLKNSVETAKEHKANGEKSTFKNKKSNFKLDFGLNIKDSVRITISIIMLCIAGILMLMAFVMHSIDTQNIKTQNFKYDAGAVCSTYAKEYGNCGYENMYSAYGIDGYRMTGVSYAREMDFDADGNSELLICYCNNGIYFVEVWGYVDDEFVNMYQKQATQTQNKEDDVWITIRYGDGKYYIGEHNSDDITQVSLYALKKDKFTKKEECVYNEKDEAFYVDEELDSKFERIKLSVLRMEKAESVYTTVTETIESFATTGATIDISSNNAQSVNNAYYEIVNKYNSKYGQAEYIKDGSIAYIDGLALVDLVDFNNDDVPELVLGYRKGIKVRDEDNQGNYISILKYKYYCEIYTYKNKQAVRIFENEGISTKINNDDDVYFMYKKNKSKNQLCINTYSNTNYGQNVHASSTLYDFDGSQFEIVKKAEYSAEYGYYQYYIDNEKVYSSKFNSEGYFLPLFNGNDNYDTNEYCVTYLSRASSNATDVEPTVEKTVESIQQLYSNYSP